MEAPPSATPAVAAKDEQVLGADSTLFQRPAVDSGSSKQSLKTVCLQGEAYDETRDLICQIPAEMGYPPYIGARMKAYGLNDAPRRWWNILDSALRSYGLVPTRADRCTYVCYGKEISHSKIGATKNQSDHFDLEGAIDFFMEPVSGNNAQGRLVHGVLPLHVDDLLVVGGEIFE